MKKTIFYDNIIRWIGKLGFCGALRFRIVHRIYKIFEPENMRNGEWDFALKYIYDLSFLFPRGNRGYAINKLRVLDVGSTDSLLVYEFDRRGFATFALDQRDYQEKLPKEIPFLKHDITSGEVPGFLYGFFHYVTAISTIEHIGLNAYGDRQIEHGDRLAMESIYKMLYSDGFLIITVPLSHWQSKAGRGYSHQRFLKLIDGLFEVYTLDQTHGQLCAVLSKKKLSNA